MISTKIAKKSLFLCLRMPSDVPMKNVNVNGDEQVFRIT
jgi:hypothetical protein